MDFQGIKHEDSAVQKALKQASETVFYAPMVCLMFVGFRMRVLQLTKGTGNPQEWVQFCMLSVAYSILANTILVLIVPIFTNQQMELEEGTGDVKVKGENPFESPKETGPAGAAKATNPFQSPLMATVFTVLRYVALLALYGGFAGVLVGLFMFKPPSDIWTEEIPAVSPAVACTVTLSTTFFLVYFFLAVSRTYSQFTEGSTSTSSFEKAMLMAANTMGMAPMLCVLFLGARMRALQMDPVHGNPQKWAQNCFYCCTFALVGQTIVALIVPLVLGGKVEKSNVEGDMKYEMEGSPFMGKVLTVIRFIIMIMVYVGAFAVVCSVFTIEHPEGKELTPPLSPTMQCVVNLATQYFFIYMLLWIFITVQDFTSLDLDFLCDALESAKATVQFAPMISVLFVATRMRALQITENKGAPQGWAQDGMYLATWALLIQFFMCLLMPIFTGVKYTPDSLDASTKDTTKISNPVGAWCVTIIRYVAMIALYVGIVTVIISVFTITPETANGRGSIPLVGEVATKPPGMDSVPGVESGMEAAGSTVGAGVNAGASVAGQ